VRELRVDVQSRSEFQRSVQRLADSENQVEALTSKVQAELVRLQRVLSAEVPFSGGDLTAHRDLQATLRGMLEKIEADLFKVGSHTEHLERSLSSLRSKLQESTGLNLQDSQDLNSPSATLEVPDGDATQRLGDASNMRSPATSAFPSPDPQGSIR